MIIVEEESIFECPGLNKAKRILAITNMKNKYFMIDEIIINEGVINVYDYNISIFEERKCSICK